MIDRARQAERKTASPAVPPSSLSAFLPTSMNGKSSTFPLVSSMEENEIVILVADRNRHVRELLQRVLGAEGYRVQIAGDGREVMTILDGEYPPHLLVIDLEVPLISIQRITEKLRERSAPVPVVIHTLLTETACDLGAKQGFIVVEKTGDTDRLRSTIDEIASRFYPARYASRKAHARA